MERWKIKLTVVGVVPTFEYQRAKYLVETLFQYMPDKYHMPELRPMMDVVWKKFIVDLKRRISESPWRPISIDREVAVFVNNIYLGDDIRLQKIVDTTYHFKRHKDFKQLGVEDLMRFLDKTKRPHIYCTISINQQTIGTLLIELYIDLVPETCNNFLRLCKQKPHGYTGSPIHRICKNSFIQIGGWKLLPEKMHCENYYIGHDTRGVLSMCNDGRHKHNSTQFFITLEPASWMDRHYVAFGQVIHGESVLEQIENEPTIYESPVYPIQIEQIGEYNMIAPQMDDYFRPIYEKYKEKINDIKKKCMKEKEAKRQAKEEYYEKEQICSCWDSSSTPSLIYPPDITDPLEIGSILSQPRNEKK